ncbi:proteinase-activated receptor 3 [Sceloporus undulatus]|uniref:proteinase-activated receptor 3 n=1 Tax=Sceloporus undulatus TaxID=8520 RepID=UPI001C4AAA5B|nr:proteinase-activated receptor 3 [Sceloporus undulatus]
MELKNSFKNSELTTATMKTLVLLTTGLFFMSSCQKENKCSNSTLGCQESNSAPGKTFHSTVQDVYEKIPSSSIEGVRKANQNKDNKCTSVNSNISTLKINNVTMEYFTSSLSTKLIPAIYIAVVLIGIPSNAITLWMLFSKMRSVRSAIFYTNLAISDFLFCIMLPFRITYHLNGNNWIFGEAMCRIMTVIFYGNMYCSTLLLTCISISRYVAIVHPFTYRNLPKQLLSTFACGTVWIVMFLYMIPLITTKQSYYLDQLNIISCHDVSNSCQTWAHLQHYYFIFLAVGGFLIPLCIVIFCYVSIIRTLKVYNQKWFWYIKVSLLILSIFAVCFTPSNILLIAHHMNYYDNSKDSLYIFYLIALSLSSLNSCLDPFLYFMMSKINNNNKTVYLTTIKAIPEEQT